MAKENVRKFKSEIKTICECPICYEEYDDTEHIPRVLPCQHTFCTKCLSKQIRRQKLKCPLCNQEHYLKNGKVTTLAKDYTICNLKELLDKFSSSLCKECNNNTHVQYVCKTCDSQMCHICYCERKVGRCSAHTFENQGVITSTTDTTSDSVCFLTGHEKNELKFFCCEKSCSIAVCANCIVESHKNHKTMSITEEFIKRKNVLQTVLQVTRKKITNVKLSLDTICKRHALVSENYQKGKNSLNLQIERGQKYFSDYQSETEKYADEKFQKCIEMLEKRRAQMKFFIDNSTECCAITEEALSGENMIAFLSVEKTLTEKLKIFEQTDVQGTLDTMPAASDFGLQIPTLALKDKIDRMISKGDGSKEKFKFNTEYWKSFGRKLRIELGSSCLDMFVSLFMFLTLYTIVFLKLYPLPYSRVFSIDNTFSAITENQSSLLCYSTDLQRISNMPMENMRQTCGNNQKPYIFRGAFTKKYFDYLSREPVVFHIDVSGIKKYSPGLILFEFGVSKGSVERRDLLGPSSKDVFGWMLTVLTSEREVALINSEGRAVFSDIISVFDKASYTYYIEFTSDRTIVLKTRDKNGKSFKILDETKSITNKSKMGFAKMCLRSDAYVTIKLSRRNMTFNRDTLYPNLYIAGDNRTISNNHQSTLSRELQDHTFQDISLLNCKKRCVYVVYVRVIGPGDNDVFSLVLTNSQFLPSAHYNISLFTYTRCTVANFVKYESYCFMLHKGSSRYALIPADPNIWHPIIIMVNRQQNSASFMVGNHEMQIENGYIFEQHTPILRFVMQSTEDSVEIFLAHNDDFDIFMWAFCKIVPYVDYLFSFIPVPRQYLCVLFVIMAIAYIWYNREGETEAQEGLYQNRYAPRQNAERNFPFLHIPRQYEPIGNFRRRRR